MSKINLIKAIVEFHPTAEAGRKRGWNHYTGGFHDSGDWYFRKLLDASEEELFECLWEMCYSEAKNYKMRWMQALCDCKDTRTEEERLAEFRKEWEFKMLFTPEYLAQKYYEQCRVNPMPV